MRMEYSCGRLGVQTIDEIAWRAATRLLEFTRPWALTLDPDGRVMLERPKHAHPDDLLGVFDGEGGLLAASRRVRDEIAEAARDRLPSRPTRRVTVSNPRRRAA